MRRDFDLRRRLTSRFTSMGSPAHAHPRNGHPLGRSFLALLVGLAAFSAAGGAMVALGAGTAEASRPTSVSLCDHPWLPVALGTTWEYDISNGTGHDTYTYTVTRRERGGFVEHRTQASWQADLIWLCSPAGLVMDRLDNVDGDVSLPNWNTLVAEPEVQAQRSAPMKLMGQVEGVTLPVLDQLSDGDRWKTTYWTYNWVDAVVRKYRVDLESTLIGTETIIVPAGTFRADRIDWTEGPLTATSWYAPGVGLVKMVQTLPGFPTMTHVLTSYTPEAAQ
jgi:hypothetical protein